MKISEEEFLVKCKEGNIMVTNKQPKIGSYVKITWLPSCINAPDKINPYIGMQGEVDYLYDNGGFCINTGSAILCIIEKKYKYILLTN